MGPLSAMYVLHRASDVDQTTSVLVRSTEYTYPRSTPQALRTPYGVLRTVVDY